MADAAVKQGFLYLQQQQTFGKKWRRFRATLYGQSGFALARLELQEGSEKSRRGEVIRLSDCVRVTEDGGEASSPKDTSTFLLKTKERLYLLAAPTTERSGWVQAICLLAFPGERRKLSGLGSWPCMEENELYSTATTVAPCKEFAVVVRQTEASERCQLWGAYTLRTGKNALELWGGPEPRTQLYEWPYRFLRRFGRDKVTFSFEAGRRCASGEGNFEFKTQQGDEIFLALEEAISAQKNAAPPGPQTPLTTGPVVQPRPESPYSRPHDSLPPSSPTAPAPPSRPRGPEGEYAVPFDAVARKLGKSLRGILVVPPQPPADPLYDSIEERPPLRPDHIYDEPEGVAALPLYDSPHEPQGEAWRRQAMADGDPSGLQHTYPAGKDWLQGAEYDNVILKKGPK
ncbi:docking protein 2 [Pteronotus mesoamericanus]|uniref:docking protein 2 n=1 Tax=Pteronotus mesoamericanus TaxID=1884717 RepID=UPI0023ECD9BA|nr:docking protein 2 [Pteronotus parnellii mesoamericanus]